MSEKQRLSIILVVCALLAGGIMFGYNGVQAEIPEVNDLQTIEGHVSKINADEYYMFEVTFKINGESRTAKCAASIMFNDLYAEGCVSEGMKVLAVVDMSALTGTVFDSVETFQPEEPVPEPEPEPVPVLDLPIGVELVSCEPAPNPELVAPEGKVKLTVLIHPGDVDDISTNIPPGIYYVDRGLKVLFKCRSENPSWEFMYWNVGMGASGSVKKNGVGYEHYLRLTMETDSVLMACHRETI